MKSLLELLGLGSREPASSSPGDTTTVRKIVAELEAMEPERARFLAAFAYLLSRVAHADFEFSAEETGKMEEIVRQLGDLPAEQAVLVVEIAKSQSRLFGATENFQVARELRRISTPEQRRELLHCLFAVSAADDSISGDEETQIRLIAEELGFSLSEYVAVRTEYNDKRSVIQRLNQP